MASSNAPWGTLEHLGTTYACWFRGTVVGDIYLTCNGTELTGCFFEDHQKYWAPKETDVLVEAGQVPVLDQACAWLEVYFQGKDPGPIPPVNFDAVSPFRRMVCEEMCKIPYGQWVTYGDIGKAVAARQGKERTSAQAVGGGVGHNPIGIIVPCHRVIGANKSLTGYGGGMHRKIALLELEGFDMTQFTVPTKGTAL